MKGTSVENFLASVLTIVGQLSKLNGRYDHRRHNVIMNGIESHCLLKIKS